MANLRESDVIGRLGGDEFAVFLTNTSLDDSVVVLQHLQQAVQAFNQSDQRQYQLDYCVGAVQYDPARHPDLAALQRDADAAMYERKKARRATP